MSRVDVISLYLHASGKLNGLGGGWPRLEDSTYVLTSKNSSLLSYWHILNGISSRTLRTCV